MHAITAYLVLCRVPLSLFVTCSAVIGYIIAAPAVLANLLPVVGGVLLLSCGASALNQYQERDIDGLMDRTCRRPLPAGSLSPRQAITAAIALLAAGMVLLLPAGRPVASLGAAALCWYNGLYTALKRRTAFAAVLGAPAGMAPPAMGWLAGGGAPDDPRLLVLCTVLFLWQVAHSWLLQLRDTDDLSRTGLPSLARTFPPAVLRRIIITWTVATAALPVLFPLFGMVRLPLLFAALLPLATLCGATAVLLLRGRTMPAFRMNLVSFAVMMAVLSVDAVLRR